MGHSEQTGTNTLREHIFEKLFETWEIAKFTPAKIRSYEDSLKHYRIIYNSSQACQADPIFKLFYPFRYYGFEYFHPIHLIG